MSDGEQVIRPICFMVMPFRRKKTDEPKRQGAPDDVDCDALWDRAFRPAIEKLGYIPVRADNDPGSVIVKDMLERLALADLVLADVSLPNGNVYYEVGLRHVAHRTDCVLLAASWSRQLFDIDQFTAIRYELSDGDVPQVEADAIADLLVSKVPALKGSLTPFHEFIAGPADEQKRKGVFRDHMARLAAFQARIREVRLGPPEARATAVGTLRDGIQRSALEIPEVAVEMLCLIRDELEWNDVVAFIESLPDRTRQLPYIHEQYLLAIGNTGKNEQAIANLEQLIREHGDSPERRGLIGGRYKRLWRAEREARLAAAAPATEDAAKNPKKGKKKSKKHAKKNATPASEPSARERLMLDCAIESYEAGMQLDLNQYYCSSNLPALLRARGEPADLERAELIDRLVIAACERALSLGIADEWFGPTLLGAAFRAAAVEKAARLAEDVRREGAARWKLETTINDLADIVDQTGDRKARAGLREALESLRESV
jgi:hypothetical protein